MHSLLLSIATRPQAFPVRLAVWVAAVATLTALGVLRTSTEAEFAFASAAIVPVVAVAWTAGRRHGLVMSILAAGMWTTADLMSGRQFSAAWIPPINCLTQLATYGFVTYVVSEIRSMLVRERQMATHDSLTGLLNRRGFFEAGDGEVSRSRRYGHPLAVMFLDLDNFKQLNDNCGHHAGDQALIAVAGALRTVLRVTDRVARLGGDEFAVLLPEIGYSACADAGRKATSAIDDALARFPPVHASVGIAWFEASERAFPAMLREADGLMYEVKQAGKRATRIRRYDADTSLHGRAAQHR